MGDFVMVFNGEIYNYQDLKAGIGTPTSPPSWIFHKWKTNTDTELLMKGLHFANGIAISKNDDFLLVNETGKYRVLKYFLKGPKKRKIEIFNENLPGFPDGISNNGEDIFFR